MARAFAAASMLPSEQALRLSTAIEDDAPPSPKLRSRAR
jgi:hypothetical protein